MGVGSVGHRSSSPLARAGPPVLAGGCAYVGVIAMSQAVQYLLGITTATPILPTLLGLGAVSAAARAALQAADAIDERAGRARGRLASAYGRNDLTIPITGLLLHAGLGSARFWALSPSSLASTGAFARLAASLPAGLDYATASQREKLQRFGRRFGCHTCGTRFAKLYVGDHVPPLSLAKERSLLARIVHGPVKFRFHPQCKTCCAKQATALARQSHGLTGRAAAGASVFHFPSILRPPTYVGAALVGIALAVEAKWPAALQMVSATDGVAQQVIRYSLPLRKEMNKRIHQLNERFG